MGKNVVITGLGCVSPCGNDVLTMWGNVKNGHSGISKITSFDTANFLVQVAGEVKDFSLDNYNVEHKISRKLSRFQKFALASSIEAVTDAKLQNSEDLKAACIISGVGVGLSDSLESGYRKLLATSDGCNRISPLMAPQCLPNEAASAVSMFYGITGTSLTIGTACASGSDSLGIAKKMIEYGIYDIALAIGCDANITPFAIASYGAIGALVTGYGDEPTKACRPFDKGHAGFVMAEGSATLVLESEEHAKNRGANIYAYLKGYGSTSDAHHLTAPLKDGSGGARAFFMALKDANLLPNDIQYYNAHGTSTSANDSAESAMLKTVFGQWAENTTKDSLNDHLRISSTKSTTGHMIGAAGAIEAVICCKALNEGFVPPTINLSTPDIERGCTLDYTANVGVSCKMQNVASCSLGFGGHNACIIIGK